MVFPFEWALTHTSFPRILPDSPKFSGAIPKFFSKFDVRMNFISQMFSKIDFKLFSLLAQPLCFSFSQSISTIHGGISCRHFSDFEDRRRVPLKSLPVLPKMCSSILMSSSHNCFDCENSFHPSDAFQESLPFLIIHMPSFLNITHSQPSTFVLQILPVDHSSILFSRLMISLFSCI